MTNADLMSRHCSARASALTDEAIVELLPVVQGWALVAGSIWRTFELRDYHETIAFVNALAWMIHAEDHHPILEVSYKSCQVNFNTHSVGGISENDFICAAKANAIYAARTGP